MSSSRHHPELLDAIEPQTPRISRAVQGMHDLTLAQAVNCALFNHPAARANLDLCDTAGTYSFSYVRNPGARYLRLEAHFNGHSGYGGVYGQIDLTARDAAGHSVASSDAKIPNGFKNERHYPPYSVGAIVAPDNQLVVVGYLDCDALDDDLTNENWSLDFALTFTGGAELNSLQLVEMPRFLCDDLATHGGTVPGNYQRDAPIDDSAQKGLERILSTLQSARRVQRSYVALAWRQQVAVTTETPNTTATSYQYLSVLNADSAPQTWRMGTRQVYTGATAGEAARYRVLYRMSDGAGTEKGRFRVSGNATGSPWETGDLNYTTTWTWSDWVTMAVRTSPTTDTLTLEGRLNGAGPTLWCAGVDVREAVS